MLNMIAGLEPFEQGSIEVDGKPVTGPGSDRVVVFQDHALFPWLTVLDNVAFGLKQKGIGQKERQERAKEQILLPLDEQTRDVHPAGYDQEGVCCPGSQTPGCLRQRAPSCRTGSYACAGRRAGESHEGGSG
ncbi:putative taurine ABC transporter, ATP-binding protein [Paenibacillus larvae subsp. larvae]|uniref:Putative taurine ABC transporter, ATP-binding protein n=2 Tax=Paenibacillus larvae subsp. larvae TaxID=147375 RepID=V9W4X2_9BACL|nr:putative taurine ABC transporter, ATP-binding protein [Paenibacillus larvae subsp. larvae DSM 25430]AVF23945.1 putative taurine ABC transporter, ATP-binding protein [Paenibacillus larvae subsp. larvae]ETK29381.1 putative taurine ABC transporter, ATP-binding protein [Paenibacillus larvae subsp. larvae DSM 25719]QHZ49553.1 putative taurine ABC transporter, ATP-binding protein [Paenibacillus larvae subsp. larvae]